MHFLGDSFDSHTGANNYDLKVREVNISLT